MFSQTLLSTADMISTEYENPKCGRRDELALWSALADFRPIDFEQYLPISEQLFASICGGQ